MTIRKSKKLCRYTKNKDISVVSQIYIQAQDIPWWSESRLEMHSRYAYYSCGWCNAMYIGKQSFPAKLAELQSKLQNR